VCQDYNLFEQALAIYKKFDEPVLAIQVITNKLNELEGDMKMAQEYAEKTNLPDVWTELGTTQLQKDMLKEAIASFIKAKNPKCHANVIN
jgi:clathrin heavy chain